MTQHINYVRRVIRVSRMNLRDFLPPEGWDQSFAVFGGNAEEREIAAIRGIARACGEVGVIVLHNDTRFEDQLGTLQTVRRGQYHVYCANRNGNRAYDPLYGLEENDVLNSIIPFDPSGAAAPNLAMARAGLTDYLRIMQWQHQHQSAGIGDYPYNLDLLLSLVSMSYMQLEARVLNYLPQLMQDELKSRLSGPGLQQSVWNMVQNYAVQMQAYLWQRQNAWQNHSRFSITTAVHNRQIISIRVPNSNPELLHACGIEINSLVRRGIPFMLVCYGLRVSGEPLLENLFFNTHNNWSTGLISPTLSSAADINRIGDVLRFHQQVVVFPCSSIEEAGIFSDAMGSYYRLIHPRTHGRNRRAFHLLPELTRQVGYQETEVRNIRPEELMNGSVLLCGEDTEVPVLVRTMTL